MSKEIYGSKATITFTMQQALDFITEKLQDDFSSDFKFSVEISDNSCTIATESQKSSSNPEAISDNPWLIPDEDGWFTHDPGYTETDCPDYIQEDKQVTVKLRACEADEPDDLVDLANNWNWRVDDSEADVIKWKYAE